jgi:hypothetical protein
MPIKRKSQKAGGSCSYVNQGTKVRRSQRAGGCGVYSGESRRAGAKRSMRGGGCSRNHKQEHGTNKRSMRGGGSCSSHKHQNGTNKRSRKSKSKNRKRVVVMCDDGGTTCRRR